MQYLWMILLVGAVTAADQLSKVWVVENIPLYSQVEATISATNLLGGYKQRVSPTKKLDLFSKKCWTSATFCGMLLC